MVGRKLFHAVSTSLKLLADGRLFLRFHDAVAIAHEQHALQPLSLAVASLYVLRAVAHPRVFTVHLFCIVFSEKFNTMSVFSPHQLSSVRK